MNVINVDNSSCFDAFFSTYKAIIEQKYSCLREYEVKVFERSSSEFADYKNNPVIDKNWFDSPLMCGLVTNSQAEIYRVTDFGDRPISQESLYALILHEFGHLIFELTGKAETKCDEENFADCIASEIVGPKKMIIALNEMARVKRSMELKEGIKRRIKLLNGCYG